MEPTPSRRDGDDDFREASAQAGKAPRLDAPDQQLMSISNLPGSLMEVLETVHEDEPSSPVRHTSRTLRWMILRAMMLLESLAFESGMR